MQIRCRNRQQAWFAKRAQFTELRIHNQRCKLGLDNAGITYIATDEYWLYLAALTDIGSRAVLRWNMNIGAHRRVTHLKVAKLHGNRFVTWCEVMDELTFYNSTKLRQALGYVSPMQFERGWAAAQQIKIAA